MRLQNPFSALDTTSIDSQVLTVLSGADHYFTIEKIHNLLPEGGSPQGVRKSIRRLVKQGTVLEQVTGRSYAFALNREHLFIDAILQIAQAKKLLIDRLATMISEWEVKPSTVMIFGSAARDEMSNDSDIDILFVLPDDLYEIGGGTEQVFKITQIASKWTGNPVNPLIYKNSEISDVLVLDLIAKEGIPVFGDPNWLKKKLHSKSKSTSADETKQS